MKIICTCFAILQFYVAAISQVQAPASKVGFESIVSLDSSRIYKPGTAPSDTLHYRPVELDVWYPSTDERGQQLSFGDFLKLFEDRATKYQDVQDYTGLAEELANQVAIESGLEIEYGKKLLKQATNSYSGLQPIGAKQPLILYLASFNGMGYENYRLLESLAKQGYVVVSIWSVGRYPGNMTTNKLDMLEQVYDAEYAVDLLKTQKELMIDFDNIGVLGCSWGGLSAAVFANRNDVNAMVTLDGSENYLSEGNEEEDDHVHEIFTSVPIIPRKKNSAYLCLKSDGTFGGEYNYFAKTNAEKYYARVLNSRHEDFLCLSSILNDSDSAAKRYNTIMQASLIFFDAQLKRKGDFNAYYNDLDRSNMLSKISRRMPIPAVKTHVILAKVVDGQSDSALSLVNVGIVHKQTGTVTDESGSFELRVTADNINDSMRVSTIGYKPQTYIVRNLLNRKEIVIALEKDIQPLHSVVVSARKFKKKKIGNKTTSRFISTPFTYDQLGAEIGTKLNVTGTRVIADAFNFHIAHNRLKNKAWFRLNIYEIRKGFPSKNIVPENIIIPVEAMQTGTISINLKPYRIILSKDVIVTIEWVKNAGEPQKGEAIYFSLGLFTRGTFVRPSSQAKMKKHGSMGVGFNMDIRY